MRGFVYVQVFFSDCHLHKTALLDSLVLLRYCTSKFDNSSTRATLRCSILARERAITRGFVSLTARSTQSRVLGLSRVAEILHIKVRHFTGTVVLTRIWGGGNGRGDRKATLHIIMKQQLIYVRNKQRLIA
jgi:hypothetical protein